MRALALALIVAGCGSPAPEPTATDAAVGDAALAGDAAYVGDAAIVGDAAAAPDARPPAPADGAAADLAPAPTVIRVHYPAGGHALAVRGSTGPLDWNHGLPMTAGADDTWTWQSDAVAAPLEWKPLLDDATWSRGPNYKVMPGATVDAWPHFTSTAGKVVVLIQTFHSQKLPDDRTIRAYLPASYDENTRATYPVVYMHDGQNLFDPALAFGGNEWMVDETLDGAAEDGSIRETIVIGIDNTPARIYELTPTDGGMGGGGGDAYLAMITDELKPRVDQMLRTRPGRADTAILGSSLGGLISAYAGVKRPDVFGLVGAMSPSTWWDNDVIIGDVAATKGAKVRPDRVYVDSGDSGQDNDDVANTNMLAQTYLSIGYVEGADFHHVVQAGGQHNEIYWAQRLPGALAFLLGARVP